VAKLEGQLRNSKVKAQQLTNHKALLAQTKDTMIATLQRKLAASCAEAAELRDAVRAADARAIDTKAAAAAQVTEWCERAVSLEGELAEVRENLARLAREREAEVEAAREAAVRGALEQRATVLALAAVAAEVMAGAAADPKSVADVRSHRRCWLAPDSCIAMCDLEVFVRMHALPKHWQLGLKAFGKCAGRPLCCRSRRRAAPARHAHVAAAPVLHVPSG
jgi:hypothetical protein